jgi:nucleoid-associated protein YgaU
MTADAKIGLLLGLVFIVIIAVIINGLPFGHSKAAAVIPAVKPVEAAGGATAAQNPLAKADWQPMLNTDTSAKTGDAAATSTTASEIAVAKDGPASGQAQPATELSATAKEPLDMKLKTLADSLKTTDTASNGGSLKVEPAMDTTITKTESVTSAPTSSVKPAAPSVASDKGGKTTPVPAAAGTAKNAAVREYVVLDGEDLGTIARKVYGTSKNGNIDRIYEFNKSVLKSPDLVSAGQKLRIPPLPAATTATTTTATNPAKQPADVLPASHFQAVSSVGKANAVETKTTSAAVQVQKAVSTSSNADGRWYVVQANDNLWKIAVSQLGNGTRSEEIAKLNAAVLKNKDSVTVGMRLKLPAK